MPMPHTRRRLLGTMALAGAAGLVRPPRASAAEEPLETTTVRLAKLPGICIAPQYVAEELLRGRRLHRGPLCDDRIGARPGEVDRRRRGGFQHQFCRAARGRDRFAGRRSRCLAGVHVGCFELFGREGLRSIADLKGRSVGVQALGSSQYVFLAAIAANVGLDPVKDIRWIIPDPRVAPIELFADGKIDAFLGFPPEPQELRARGIGHVIVNSSVDRPWSQYFCCMLAGNREFVRKHPVATKRVCGRS